MFYILLLNLFCIAYFDWKHRRIPNLMLMTLLLCLVPTLKNTIELDVIAHFFEVLIIGFVFVSFGIIGAGDVKLLAVISLAVKPAFFLLFLFSITSLGGLLAIGYLIYGYCTDINKVRARGIPYGLPIVISAAWALFVSIH
ncbi:prepilin peptidase [Vibrio rarus]|uniref:A24 family peptidase n=1 Tax=Vibrio rarus TaxID=413403 RepID=UPI0021C37BC1|nr:prepilin peptidase [Vibrio rarus]